MSANEWIFGGMLMVVGCTPLNSNPRDGGADRAVEGVLSARDSETELLTAPSSGGKGGVVNVDVGFGGGIGASGGGAPGTGGLPSNGGESGSSGGGSGGVTGTGGRASATGGAASGGTTALCSESATRSCGLDGLIGNCATGVETCVGGKWDACSIAKQSADGCLVAGDDANCNGVSNEACSCVGSTTRSCALDGLMGNCAKGTEACTGGKWGPCSIAKQTSDSCAIMGDDANCDGTPNEGCTCVAGATRPCGPQIAQGLCKQGAQTCMANAWGACQGAVYPALRNCASALDNDCDGRPDNTIDTVCQCTIGQSLTCGGHPGLDGKGPCRAGTQSCVAGANNTTSSFAACVGAVGPVANDTCDMDNDANCNGMPNERCACINGKTQGCGNCGGSQNCVNGAWGSCSMATPATYGQACSAGVGACLAKGTIDCSASCTAKAGSPDSAHTTPAPNGSWDWNCDGRVEIDLTLFSPSPCILFGKGSWVGSTYPACGDPGTYSYSSPTTSGCETSTQLQACQ